MERHLTVADVTEFTGKSESAIKRFIRDLRADPERPFVHRTVIC
jgi:hypothetical protein